MLACSVGPVHRYFVRVKQRRPDLGTKAFDHMRTLSWGAAKDAQQNSLVDDELLRKRSAHALNRSMRDDAHLNGSLHRMPTSVALLRAWEEELRGTPHLQAQWPRGSKKLKTTDCLRFWKPSPAATGHRNRH